MSPLPAHLPADPDDLRQLGWSGLDIILVSGDAQVDHPSFPASLLGRWLAAGGWRVGLIARPRTDSLDDVTRLGEPRLFFGVTAGALDSMVANYTALKRRRSTDPYAPGGQAGDRPDRALTVYCQLLRHAFGKGVLIVGGGLEASLRRFAHYDYWSDKVRRSVLMDCGADVLIHGMGEGPVADLARRLDALPEGERRDPALRLQAIRPTPGLVYRTPAGAQEPSEGLALPSAEGVATDARVQAQAFRLAEQNRDRCLWQDSGGMRVIANPAWTATPADLDEIHALAFRRDVHPRHGLAPVPALEQVRFSITAHRGCFGGCAFCAIGAHQGRDVVSRSQASILAEVTRLVEHPQFRGTVADIGGPSANMYGFVCGAEPRRSGRNCRRASCLWPKRCRHLQGDQRVYASLLARAADTPGVAHLHVTTGLRMDLALECPSFLKALARRHVSGQLKVAPEHLDPGVLALMRKPAAAGFAEFKRQFERASEEAGKRQYLLPYLMAAHPGTTLEMMAELALFLRRERIRVEQVQIFTPTPGTASTVMYATGLHPVGLTPVFVERNQRRKRLQKALLLSHLGANRALVDEALRLCGRTELAPALRPVVREARAPAPQARREKGPKTKSRPRRKK